MPSIAASVVEPALRESTDPLATDLLARLRREGPEATWGKATRAFSRQVALQIYERKAIKGDRPGVRTDGYPPLLAALAGTSEDQVIVHGVAFDDAVYLVFTDASRTRCLGVLRKVLLEIRSCGGVE
jgi:hypothetical protein